MIEVVHVSGTDLKFIKMKFFQLSGKIYFGQDQAETFMYMAD